MAEPPRAMPHPVIDRERVATLLADYLRINTSNPPGLAERQPEAFRFIRERWANPLGLEAEETEGPVLLLRGHAARGAAVQAKPPVLFLGHADVVPVAEEERARWTHPPFAGKIVDGYVWGRGALDNKASLVCLLEGMAALQAAGEAPRRDVVVAVMPDEETGGHRGVRRFVEQHLDELDGADLVIDEGSCVAPDIIPNTLLAAIAVGEKCQLALRVVARGQPGHASMPSSASAPVALAEAITRIARHKFPAKFLEPVGELLDRMAERQAGLRGAVLRNRAFFKPVVERALAATPAGNAMIRHTVSPTILRAGEKINVIPGQAEAWLDVRMLPGHEPAEVVEGLRAAVGRLEPDIAIEVASWDGDTPMSPARGATWDAFRAVLEATLPGCVVAPVLCPGMTDARYFARKGRTVYRFLPFILDKGERARVHGIDERISIDNLVQGARVYAHLLRYV